jgi:hypothetical protein
MLLYIRAIVLMFLYEYEYDTDSFMITILNIKTFCHDWFLSTDISSKQSDINLLAQMCSAITVGILMEAAIETGAPPDLLACCAGEICTRA